MLKGIPDNMDSDLLKALADMGHGDILVLADHFYPAKTKGRNGIVVNAKGNTVPQMLASILQLMPLDSEYCSYPVELIRPDAGCEGMLASRPQVWDDVIDVVRRYDAAAQVGFLTRTAFYEKAARAYVTVSTSEDQPYGCVILQKGVR